MLGRFEHFYDRAPLLNADKKYPAENNTHQALERDYGFVVSAVQRHMNDTS